MTRKWIPVAFWTTSWLLSMYCIEAHVYVPKMWANGDHLGAVVAVVLSPFVTVPLVLGAYTLARVAHVILDILLSRVAPLLLGWGGQDAQEDEDSRTEG